MADVQDYRLKAARFSALAESSLFPEVARQYKQLALEYERLAKWASGFAVTPLPAEQAEELVPALIV